MRFKKAVSLLTIAGLGCALSIAVMERRAKTAAVGPQVAGLAIQMSPKSAFSAVVGMAMGGSANSLNEIALLGDLDGREDLVADHALKIADATATLVPGQTLTRFAISEHTIANGFAENVFYYGDSLGNVTVGAYTNADTLNDGLIDTSFVINLPTVLNAFGTLDSDDQIVVTGLAVSPVADLTSFANVNGNFAPYSGLTGEILYVTFTDTTGGFRSTSNGALIRSGVLAFPVADITSATATTPASPGIISPSGFPVQMGGAFGVAFSVFSNMTGIAVDDDGSVYFQQADLINLTGANIVKITPVGTNNTRSLATSGFMTMTTLSPVNGSYGTASGPAAQSDLYTNYSGTSKFFGNIAAIATGPSNVLYAAVARSLNPNDPSAVKSTEGPFANLSRLGPTPSMVISFADSIGGTNNCNPSLTAPDGIADVIVRNQGLVAGVNNFQTFVMGTGPDRRGAAAAFGTAQNTRKLDFQVDYTIYSGITVDEEGKVYLISGGTPAGVGSNPSPNRGEILLFPDDTPYDRRADYIDLRGEVIPSPSVTSGNVGNGKADRYDYIFWEAPIDPVSSKPIGIAGLTHGFLLYTNRTHPTTGTSVDLLPNGATQAADSTAGPINYEDFDPGHQVAGGDDQNFPFRGDDSDGYSGPSNPAIAGPLNGGFEFVFGGNIGGTCTSPWNTFFLNSNGNVSFGAGDGSPAPTTASLLTGSPRIAPAWANLDTASRTALINLNTFPVQAMGFAGINDFKVRWIDVPETGGEACGSSNTFEVSLYDDGTGVDENSTQPLNPANPIGNNEVPFDHQEGPTDLRFSSIRHGASPRPDGSGYFRLHYAHMDLIGTPASPDMVGYSLGDQDASPPDLCTDADLGNLPFGKLIGNGSQAAAFEFFATGSNASPLVADFDLRFEGANRFLATPKGQLGQSRDTLWWNGADCSTAGEFTCPK
ncbi:MAG TPA: hypothetical protein VGG60_12805 [Candidatus Binataceae bacterium]|jgi:hypothetical protein